MKTIILAAGYATRLYPLTLNTPKCLLSVAGKTILDWLCEKLEPLKGLEEVTIVTNAKFFDQLEEWKKGARLRVPVRILNDGTLSNDSRLGAIGDLDFSIKKLNLDTDILMLASDNLFDTDLGGFLNFCEAKKDKVCVGLYDIKDRALAAKKYGVLEVNNASEVLGIEEKPEKPKSSLIGMGVYYFPKNSLPLVGDYLSDTSAPATKLAGPSSGGKDAPGYYIRWLVDRIKIFGFQFQGMWYDIGDLKALEEAEREIKNV